MTRLRTAVTPSAAPPAPPLRLQRKCACDGSGEACTDCDQKRDLHRHATDQSTLASVPPIVGDVLNSSGQPLDTSTREFMETRFGHDFSNVRIHNDPHAGESASAVHALAYTVGDHVVFRPDHYAPSTDSGRRLLAHELTHVVQQQSAPSSSLSPFGEMRVSSSDDPSEREADAIADQVLRDTETTS